LETQLVRRLHLALISSVIVILATAGSVLAWSNPDLQALCAEDENTYSWRIVLPTESNYDMQFSWNNFTTVAFSHTFPGNGAHEFTTPRDGATLYVRFEDDHGAKDSQAANSELCEPPSESQPGESAEGSVGGGTGTPPQGGSIPDTATSIPSQAGPLATIGAGMILLASLGALAYANVRTSRR
jgi:hypothetical protein